jgi:hypothetical protein
MVPAAPQYQSGGRAQGARRLFDGTDQVCGAATGEGGHSQLKRGARTPAIKTGNATRTKGRSRQRTK